MKHKNKDIHVEAVSVLSVENLEQICVPNHYGLAAAKRQVNWVQ